MRRNELSVPHAENVMKHCRFMRSPSSNQNCRQENVRAQLRADIPESLGPAGVGIVPAVTRRRRCTCPRRRGSGCDEADGRSGRDRAAGTPSVCEAYKTAGANTNPDTRTNTRRANHRGASHGSHAAARCPEAIPRFSRQVSRGFGRQVSCNTFCDHLQEICARMRRTPAEDDCSFLMWKRPISEVLFTCGPPQNSSDTSPIL
ncbi:MAG: hypothetical protein QOJ86_1631 [Bradyrhizobium sp.]|nr:hypothetical protein [Bradyrhizobium sp.]